MIILPLTESFFGREDPDLGARLLKELPGILLWAIEGWKRLSQRGRFVQPESGRLVLAELEDLSNPVGPFVRECCNCHPLAIIPRLELYDAYLEWCNEHRIHHPLADNTFGHHLLDCTYIKDIHSTIEGKRVWCYEGIALKT
jgi:putative DNA primase/helicase